MARLDPHEMTPQLEFEDWYGGVYPGLYAALTAFTRDPDVAEDCAQEALLKALEHWDHVQMMERPERWLHGVAHNVARRRGRRALLLKRLVGRLGKPVQRSDDSLMAIDLWPVVAELPLRQRTAVGLRHLGHLTEPEIAQIMGVTRGTVSKTLHAAYRELGSRLSSDDDARVRSGTVREKVK